MTPTFTKSFLESEATEYNGSYDSEKALCGS